MLVNPPFLWVFSLAVFLHFRVSVNREQLVEEALPLVARVAGAIGARLPHAVEMSDFTQAGVIGLLDAADKFDRGKGVLFRTYAELRIRGAILDSLRSLDWVPRSLRRKRRELQRVEGSLEAKLGRKPTDDELALQMKLSLADLKRTREQVRRAELAFFDTESFNRVVALTVDPDRPIPTRFWSAARSSSCSPALSMAFRPASVSCSPSTTTRSSR